MVDDDPLFIMLTEQVVRDTRMVEQMLTFSNGPDLLSFLEDNTDQPDELPEMILLDLNMPVMDGWEFLEEYLLLLPRLKKDIRICVLTSSISPIDQQRAKAISAVYDYVVKPVSEERFAGIVQRL